MSSIKKFNSTYTKERLEQAFEKKVSLSRAIGRDGTTIGKFEENIASEIDLILLKVHSQSYKFTRYREKLISKGAHSNPRVISIPTVRDRLTLRVLCEYLAEIYPNVGVRKPHSYIKRIKNYLNEVDDNHSFVRMDIQNYYPSIDRKKLLRKLRRQIRSPKALDVIEKAISAPTTKKEAPDPGIPQGLSISNILAAIYLKDLDAKLSKSLRYLRYVDDILVLCKTGEEEKVFQEIKHHLKRMKLKCHELNKETGKSYIASVDEGVSYLGFHISKSGISIRESSYKKMFSTILSAITSHKFKKNEDKLVWRLNLKITGCRYEGKRYGWMQFFIQTENLSQLSRLDNFVRVELKKRNLQHLIPKIKRFVKSYHQIRYLSASTNYIPNFDDYTINDMAAEISLIRGEDIGVVKARSVQEIHRTFFSLIKREISQMEKDLLENIS